MKIFLLFLSVASILSACSRDDVSPRKMRVTVPITLLDVDETGTANEEIQMRVRATAYNGCYSDLEILLEETDARHYILTASGKVTNSNICPENLVTRDTVIKFIPTHSDSYYFRANKNPFPILYDTLSVE